MIYFLYPWLALANFLFSYAIAYPLALALPLLASPQKGWLDNQSTWGVGPRLPTRLNWFMTPDNSLDGDATFQLINGTGYWAQVKWLWRNPAYSFGLIWLTPPYSASFSGDNTIKDNRGAKAGWCLVKAGGLFQLTYVKQIFFTSRCLYWNFGWNIRALVDDNVNPKPNPYQATFVCSPRFSGFLRLSLY